MFEENGERIDDLKMIVSRAVNAAILFDDDGISLRFMKWGPGSTSPKGVDTRNFQLDNIRSEEDLSRIIENVHFTGVTPLGSSLQDRILRPMVLDRISRNALEKPVLVLTITDGKPTGEKYGERTLQNTIQNTAATLGRSKYGVGAVSYQIAQVGNDRAATEWLASLDNDPDIGQLVDVTSSKFFSNLPITAGYHTNGTSY